MEYDFSQVDDDEGGRFTAVPPGIYEVRVVDVRESPGRNGTPHWGLQLEVCEGDFAGKTAAWDWLIWSERAAPRVKRALRAFGIDTSGTVRLDPHDLVGCRARIEVVVEEREDPRSGKIFVRNRVPYDGYEPAGGPEEHHELNGQAEAAFS